MVILLLNPTGMQKTYDALNYYHYKMLTVVDKIFY